jgi:hypothetical protein
MFLRLRRTRLLPLDLPSAHPSIPNVSKKDLRQWQLVRIFIIDFDPFAGEKVEEVVDVLADVWRPSRRASSETFRKDEELEGVATAAEVAQSIGKTLHLPRIMDCVLCAIIRIPVHPQADDDIAARRENVGAAVPSPAVIVEDFALPRGNESACFTVDRTDQCFEGLKETRLDQDGLFASNEMRGAAPEGEDFDGGEGGGREKAVRIGCGGRHIQAFELQDMREDAD